MDKEVPPSNNGPQRSTGRVMIIGLDGATFDLIEPWVEEGYLPNLARLMSQGAWGRLQSTIPAHSAPAWTTFATGLQPGKHGVYFFLGPSRDKQYFRPLAAQSIRGRRFWEVASEQGRSVGVINVPLTYPPRPVQHGYSIAGIFAPSDVTAFSSPELYREVLAHCGSYVVEADVSPNRHTYLSDMMAGMRLRCRAAEYLLERHPVDLFIVVFRMIDSIMHYYWADMDPGHPLRPQLGETLIPNAIRDAYRLLDEAVGRLVARAGSDTTVFIMSDHGFRAEYKRFAVNKWLRQQGLLHLKAGRGAMHVVGRTIKRLGLTKVAKQALQQMTGNSWQAAVWSAVDWSRTKVVYGPGPAFYLNVKGRDAAGIVKATEYEEIRQRLRTDFKAVRDPETGALVVGQVYRPEDIYQGDAIEVAPDLIPEPAEYVSDGRRWGYGFEPFPGAPQMFSIAPRYAGAHALEGILIAAGPHILVGQQTGLHIADLAPTTLYTLGLPVPEAMDGKVQTGIFSPAYFTANPVCYNDLDMNAGGKTGQVMTDEDEAKVETRLRDLGYL
jgi:predicted AlkP superfamily phosphohydrolase/phosphomutase